MWYHTHIYIYIYIIYLFISPRVILFHVEKRVLPKKNTIIPGKKLVYLINSLHIIFNLFHKRFSSGLTPTENFQLQIMRFN